MIGKLGLAMLVTVFVVGLSPSLTRSALSVVHNDRVHYVGHLVAGQMLSLCPCTASLAQTQYAKGMYHAHTPRQVMLLSEPASALLSRAVHRVVV